MDIEDLIKDVLDACVVIRKAFAPGYLESVYKRALAHELTLRGHKVSRETEFRVMYKSMEVGFFKADLIVENKLIVEAKAVTSLNVNHELQLVNYLCCAGLDHGILVNFGSPSFEAKRKFRIYSPKHR